MYRWQLPQGWPWHWAWRLFASWSQFDVDPRALAADERWSVVANTVPAVVRNRYLRPVARWLLARTPVWIVARRLQQRTHGWYRVPNKGAAEHVRLRFDIWPIDIEDHVRLQHSRLTAVGYSTATFSEVIFVLPNGEIEPDPHSPEMAKAWARYAATRQPSG